MGDLNAEPSASSTPSYSSSAHNITRTARRVCPEVNGLRTPPNRFTHDNNTNCHEKRRVFSRATGQRFNARRRLFSRETHNPANRQTKQKKKNDVNNTVKRKKPEKSQTTAELQCTRTQVCANAKPVRRASETGRERNKPITSSSSTGCCCCCERRNETAIFENGRTHLEKKPLPKRVVFETNSDKSSLRSLLSPHGAHRSTILTHVRRERE